MDISPFQFAVERYNYWIVIVLMMTGLYIVFSRGNLVKKLVGLNLFQTSVFILYISMGSISGGTAPIILGGHGAQAEHAGEAHTAHVDVSKIGNADAAMARNDLKAAAKAAADHGVAPSDGSLHAAGDKVANDMAAVAGRAKGVTAAGEDNLHADVQADEAGGESASRLARADRGARVSLERDADREPQYADDGSIIYTNPLPHVLILTAIVVGVATTAVGLALAVRIREAYGTIEEDELAFMDAEAELGPKVAASVFGDAATREVGTG